MHLLISLMTTFFGSALVLVSFGIFLWKIVWPAIHKKENSPTLSNSATATVLSFHLTGLYINKQPKIKILLQVQPRETKSFIGEVQQVLTLSELAELKEGKIIQAQYHFIKNGSHPVITAVTILF